MKYKQVRFPFYIIYSSINCQMAQRTISVNPIDFSTTIQQLQKEFQGYKIEKIAINSSKNTAYIQFSHSNDVQFLANQYPDCRVPAFNYAEIGFVSEDFTWPHIQKQQIEVNANSLLVIKNCDEINEFNEEKIRFIFKQYTIKRIIILKESKQVVLQFQNSQDLELLDMSFQDFKVPALGKNAEIDIENGFDPNLFKQTYLENKNNYLVLMDEKCEKEILNKKEQNNQTVKREKIEEKNQKQSLNASKVSQQTNIEKKMLDMQKEIMQKDRLRQALNQKLQRQRQQLEKKQRQERLKRQKQEKRLKMQAQRQQAQLLKKKQQLQKLKLQQKNKKQQQEEAEMRFIAQKIANVKKQFEEIQRKQLQSVAQLKQQYDLQRIIDLEKQGRNQKTIQLASIHSKVDQQRSHLNRSSNKIPQQMKHDGNIAKKSEVKLDYSRIPYRFIGFALLLWIYYVITK